MKKILIVMGLLTTLISCRDRGEVTQQPTDFIEIHGKIYKLMNVVPCDGCRGIWIMYPKDSADKQPQVINYSQKQGKSTVNQTIIQVD
jgi:hypothetical protein